MHVETIGTGDRPLLAITPIGAPWLLHALPSSFVDLFTVHVLELPGTGRSPGDPADATVDGVVGAVADAVAQLGIDGAVLFGHSMNGTLAMAAASSAPIGGVIAVCSPPRVPMGPVEGLASYWDDVAEPERKRRAAESPAQADRVRRWYDLDIDTSALDEIEAVATFPGAWISSVFASGAAFDWDAAHRAIAVPVLLCLGRYDFVAPPVLWDAGHSIQALTVELFDRSGHSAFYEQPDDFTRVVEAWLGSGAPIVGA